MNQTEDKQRVKRKHTETAIQMAMQSRWDDAITANKAILALFPDEPEAHNRLGKALSEIGKIKEARESYSRALEIEPSNMIARKNLERLSTLKAKAEPDKAQQVDTSLFIEEMGKSGVTRLRPTNTKTLATLSAGDEVLLVPVAKRLTVETAGSEYIADVEPKLALRLTKLIAGGNKYAAAVVGVDPDTVRVMIKETFQDPSQVGRLSFPAGKASDMVRPYTKDTIVRSDGDDDAVDDAEDDDWEDTDDAAEAEAPEVSLYDAAAREDADEPEFEE